MRMFFKVIALLLLFLLVVFSLIADLPMGRQWAPHLDLTLYIRMASLMGLMIAVFVAWGYKRRVEASQKYRRADEALAQAKETVARRQKALDSAETRLRASFAEKEQGVDKQIGQATVEYQERLKALKQQNLELKETVAKLMRALKKERGLK